MREKNSRVTGLYSLIKIEESYLQILILQIQSTKVFIVQIMKIMRRNRKISRQILRVNEETLYSITSVLLLVYLTSINCFTLHLSCGFHFHTSIHQQYNI